MIEQECQNAYGNAENRHVRRRLFLADEKEEVDDVKALIMKQEKPSRRPLCLPRRFDRLIIDAETFRGELLEIQYPAPIETPNDDALPPVDPHDISDIPFLHDSEDDRHKVGEDEERCRPVHTKVSGWIHLSIVHANGKAERRAFSRPVQRLVRRPSSSYGRTRQLRRSTTARLYGHETTPCFRCFQR